MTKITTFLDAIVERQSSFVFFGDRVYSISDSDDRGSLHRVIVGDRSFGLTSSMPFHYFESLDIESQRRTIDEECDAFVKRSIVGQYRSKLDSSGRYSVLVLGFLVNELVPFLVAAQYGDLGSAMLRQLTGETETETPLERARNTMRLRLEEEFGVGEPDETEVNVRLREQLLEKKRKELKTDSVVGVKYGLKDMGLNESDILPSVFGGIIGHQPLYVNSNRVYTLNKISQSDVPSKRRRDMVFVLNGRYYVPSNSVSYYFSNLTEQLMSRMIEGLHFQALEHSTENHVSIGRGSFLDEKMINALLGKQEYDFGGCGFIRRDEGCYVYKQIPKFAIQDGRNGENYWPYPSMKIALKLSCYWRNNKVYSGSDPVVVDPAKHVLSLEIKHRDPMPFDPICDSRANHRSYGDSPSELVRKLNAGVDVIRHQLNPSSIKRHEPVGLVYGPGQVDDVFEKNGIKPLTREEAMSNGYEVYDVLPKHVSRSGRVMKTARS